jgi:hypothetical protein
MANVGAHNGGCWYCGDDQGDMLFSFEFDTNLHLECLRKQISYHDIDDTETRIMAREFKDVLDSTTLSERIANWMKS